MQQRPKLDKILKGLVGAVGISVAADLIANLIDYLGQSEPDDRFREEAKRLRNSFHDEMLWDYDNHMFTAKRLPKWIGGHLEYLKKLDQEKFFRKIERISHW